MTIMDTVDPANDNYWENEYPYVSPDHSILDTVENCRFLEGLSAVETAYVKWFTELGVSDESFKRIIHPAHGFLSLKINARTLSARPIIRTAIRNIKKGLPFLSVYTSDYLIGILHEEIEHFRVANRYERFHNNFNPMYLGGKKSLHEEEMIEAKLLIDCVKQVQELAGINSKNNNVASETSTGGENSSVDRVISETEKLISECQARLGSEVEPAVIE